MKSLLLTIGFISIFVFQPRAASQLIDGTKTVTLPQVVVSDSTQKQPHTKPIRNVSIWARASALMGLTSLAILCVYLIVGFLAIDKLMIAGFVLSFYAMLTGALGYRKEKPKNNKWVWIGLFSGLVFLTTLCTFLFFGLLSGWAGLVSIFISWP